MTARRERRVRQYLDMISGGAGFASILSGIEGADGSDVELAGVPPSGASVAGLESARVGLEDLELGRDVPPEQLADIEAIIIPSLRPVYDVKDGGFTTTSFDGTATPGHALWTKLTSDAALKARIEAALPAIGRIELLWATRVPFGGTGFMVGRNLLMTNRHVAQVFAEGLGDRGVRFIPGRAAGIDFKRDPSAGEVFDVRNVRMIHPYWDMALLEVDGLPDGIAPMRLATADARDMLGQEVAVIGYPAFDIRNPDDVQNDVFRERFQVKRLQPGLLQGAFEVDSFGKIVPAATHDCSTLGGNSGSAVLNLATGEIVGLHFAGRYLERNFAVPTGALACDQRVVDLGLNFIGATSGSNDWGGWWSKADGATVREASVAADDNSQVAALAAATHAPQSGGGIIVSGGISAGASGGSVTFEVPLRITVSLGAAPAQEIAVATVTEALKPAPPGGAFVPRSIEDYVGRNGYDENFLSGGSRLAAVTVPMPEVADPAVLAPLKSGGTRLDYQNFSILMHARRRLALLTASNVTEEALLRDPEKGHDTSRKALFAERWFPDLRLDDKYQIPEVFYTKDNGAFDKGHIVRRDDVAWGKTFELLIKGNVDSFHVTNCSPQVEGYNRSDSGERNWGDLENHVLSEAASERLCVFAGPILAADDRVFAGKGAGGALLRAPVPRRFWKVIVARVSDGLASYGFILEQDLADTSLEFTVADEFIGAMYPLVEIAALSGVAFHQSLLDADQHDTVRGNEIALRAGARRRKKQA